MSNIPKMGQLPTPVVVLQNVVLRSCEKLYFCEPWCVYPTRSGDNLDPNRNRDAMGTPAWPYGQTKALVPVIASRFLHGMNMVI
jgi:hypothetical protein